jgi:uncharacterized protein YndB with AHSA1/START domain
MSTETDRILRQIDVDATRERVWSFISEPGWWINAGTITPHRLEEVERVDEAEKAEKAEKAEETEGVARVVLVHDPVHGACPVRIEALDAPNYAAFRWMSGPAPSGFDADASTLIEFWIDDRDDGVTVRVVESGFANLPRSDEERSKAIGDNTKGWEIELEVARGALTP